MPIVNLQETVATVRSNSDRLGSLIDLFNSRKTELEVALANQMTPEIQAAIDEVLTVEKADAAKLDVALNNGPSGPLPAPPTA